MMDHLAIQAYNPHLKKVLKSFQTAAERSLNGPSNYVETWGDAAKMTARELEEYRKTLLNGTLKNNTAEADINDVGAYHTQAPFPIKQMPIIIPMDTSKGEISDTELDGKSIACFIVGGEKRLCLPQILNTVLGDFSLQDIHNVCDELHIFCSRCNLEQLKFFKMTGILPVNAPSCGLITKTDAERLCNALLHRSPEKSFEAPSPNSFKVYHECFGKCKGVLSPELYRDPEAKCIQCVDCRGVFAPQQFVCHSHKAQENRTCHWGFDSANWRSYLLLANDQDSKSVLQKLLEDIKSRFDYVGRYKRRETSGKEESGIKKARYDDGAAYETGAWIDASAYRQGISAFRPWSPTVLSMLKEGKVIPVPGSRDGLTTVIPSYLQTGPPVLLNPERVVRLTDSHRYDRHFAPNVSLAPQAVQKFPGEEEEEEDVKPPKNLNVSPVTSPVKSSPQLDVELSSDTEDSSFHSDSMPSTPGDGLLSPMGEVASDREKEVEMLWQVLDGKIGDSRQTKEKFIQEFLHIRFRQDDRLRKTLRANKQLEQDLEAMRKQQAVQEACNDTEQLRREIDKLHYQTELQNKENQQLRHELELLKDVTHSEVVSVKAKYRGKIEDLRHTVRTYEHTTAQLQSEVNELRGKLDANFTSGETENHTPSPNSSSTTATTLSPARDSGVEEDAASASQKSHPTTELPTAVGLVKVETVKVETS